MPSLDIPSDFPEQPAGVEIRLLPGRGDRFVADSTGHIWHCRLHWNGRRWHRIDTSVNDNGYLRIEGSREIKLKRVHRLILEAFVGPCPEGMECCHRDGDKTNNRLENLRWDSRESNLEDSRRLGVPLVAVGREHHDVKLTEEQVAAIRLEYVPRSRQFGQPALAAKYAVTTSTIFKIIHGVNWRHLEMGVERVKESRKKRVA